MTFAIETSRCTSPPSTSERRAISSKRSRPMRATVSGERRPSSSTASSRRASTRVRPSTHSMTMAGTPSMCPYVAEAREPAEKSEASLALVLAAERQAQRGLVLLSARVPPAAARRSGGRAVSTERTARPARRSHGQHAGPVRRACTGWSSRKERRDAAQAGVPLRVREGGGLRDVPAAPARAARVLRALAGVGPSLVVSSLRSLIARARRQCEWNSAMYPSQLASGAVNSLTWSPGVSVARRWRPRRRR